MDKEVKKSTKPAKKTSTKKVEDLKKETVKVAKQIKKDAEKTKKTVAKKANTAKRKAAVKVKKSEIETILGVITTLEKNLERTGFLANIANFSSIYDASIMLGGHNGQNQ